MVTTYISAPETADQHRTGVWVCAPDAVQGLVETMLLAYVHPEHGFRPALGIVSLSKRYGAERLERACARALRAGATNYQSVKSILAKGLDGLEIQGEEPSPVATHANVRGKGYFAGRAR